MPSISRAAARTPPALRGVPSARHSRSSSNSRDGISRRSAVADALAPPVAAPVRLTTPEGRAAVRAAMRNPDLEAYLDMRAPAGSPLVTFRPHDMGPVVAGADVAALLDELDWLHAVVRDVALMQGANEIQAIAVGGGAAAPFIQELLRRRPPRAGKLHIEPRPATPEWAYAPEFQGNLAPVFPQLAIAIGGALAPDAMLSARGGVSPAANGRSDIRAEHD